MFLQAHLLQEFRSTVRVDPLVGEAVRALMPWQPVNKVLQRTLRFQGFLALAQAGAMATGRRGADGVAGLAITTNLTLLVLFKTGRHAAP